MADWHLLEGYPRTLRGNLLFTAYAFRRSDEKIVRGLDALVAALEQHIRDAARREDRPDRPDFGAAIESALRAEVRGCQAVLGAAALRDFIEVIHFARVCDSALDLSFSAAQELGVGRVYLDLAAPLSSRRDPPPGAPPVTPPPPLTGPSRSQRFEAAEAGDLAVLRRIDPRARDHADDCGRTLLSIACANGHAESVAWLLDVGASPTAHALGAPYVREIPESARTVPRGAGHGLLHIAAGFHQRAVVELLLARGLPVDDRDVYGATPLIVAALLGNRDGAEEVLRLLLERGADIHAHDALGKTALDHATHPPSLALLLHHGASPDGGPHLDGPTTGSELSVPPLERASASGDVDVVALLLARGASIHRAPAALSASLPHPEVTELLLAQGPSQDALDDALVRSSELTAIERLVAAGAADLDGVLALTIVRLDIARWLVARGARARRSKRCAFSALHQAVRSRNREAFDLAMAAEPLLDERDENGRTALHHAAFAADLDVVRRLLEAGADVNAKDHDGNTPHAYARTSKESSTAYRATLVLLGERGGAPVEPPATGRAAPSMHAPSLPPKGPPAADELDIDDLVQHARFGRGTVVDAEGRGAGARFHVDFGGTVRILPASSLKRVPE